MSEDAIEINTGNIAKIVISLYDRAETALKLHCFEDADRLINQANELGNKFKQMMHKKYRLSGNCFTMNAEKSAEQLKLPEYAWPVNCANIGSITKYVTTLTNL